MMPRRKRFNIQAFRSRVFFLLMTAVALGAMPGVAAANPSLTATTLAQFQQSAESASLGAVQFSSPPASYVKESGQALNFSVDNPDAGQRDVLVVAWSDEQQAVVQAFSHTVTGSPWRIAPGQLDKLPEGRVNLQLMLRDNGQVIDRAYHWLAVEPPAPVAPSVSFSGAPASFEAGSASAIDLAVEGDVPDGADMLVLAWSDDEQRMVQAFAHTIADSSWRISASRLNELPEGRNNIQLVFRLPGTNNLRSDHWVEVEAAPAPQPEPDQSVTLSFAEGTPATYSVGSGSHVHFDLSGPMPAGGSIMVLAWSDGEGRMVDAFAHRVNGEPWRINTSRLDQLPNGSNVIQARLRQPGQDVQEVTHRIEVAGTTDPDGGNGDGDGTTDPDDGTTDPDDGTTDPDDGTTDPDDGTTDPDDGTTDPDDDNNGGDDPGDGNTPPNPNFVDRSSNGWTTFARTSDSRVIYVSQSRGNDSNNGLSENSPVRSLSRGHSLLRDGSSDHMLLRRGDKWTETFPRWEKSGRSKDHRMVIGAYGEGNRPIVGDGGGSGNNFSMRPVIRHVALVGLELNGRGRNNNVRLVGEFHDFLIEDCYIHGAKDNINAHEFNGGRPSGLAIRRSVIVDARPSGGHAQGLYAGRVNGLLIEDCVWDGNGLGGGAEATIFNHNVYIFQCNDVTIRNNVFSNASSWGIKLSSNASGGSRRVLVEDNIVFANANGITVGYSGGAGYGSPLNFSDVTIRRNLLTSLGRSIIVGGNPTDQAFGIHVASLERGRIENNYVVHKTFKAGHSAVHFDNDRPNKDVMVQSNVVFNFQMNNDRWPAIRLGNGAQERWNQVELDANRYVDASRHVMNYHGWIGRPASHSAFVNEARKQRREFWRPAYEAKSVMAYIRAGYTLQADYD